MQYWLRQLGYSENEVLAAAERVHKLLTVTLNSADGQWVLKTRTQANVELALTSLQNGEVKNYIVDRTFVEDDTRWIVDYKTTELADAWLKTLQNTAENYRQQLDKYSILFANEALPIKRAILFMHNGKLVSL